MYALKLFLSSIILSIASLFGVQQPHSEVPPSPVQVQASPTVPMHADMGIEQTAEKPASQTVVQAYQAPAETQATSKDEVHVYSESELLKLADNKYADGEVPLGDGKYLTSGPKVGYIYLCNARKENFGSQENGPWIHGTTWNFLNKVSVDGAVSWSQAVFSNVVSGAYRILSGNDLPINHTTGKFPISRSDDAIGYDQNPNSISAQSLKDTLPGNPTYSSTPYCMGGEVGIMLSGVALFNGLDAPLRDAPAHEVQDTCGGHPQESGEYHYHSLSPCFKDISVTTVLGYALDGFPITGPLVAKDKYLSTEDLDVCHGLTSEITVDGKKKTTYHYVMTQDYPYSASCFRGKPVTTGPSSATKSSAQGGTAGQFPMQGGSQMNMQGGMPPAPPQEAQDACLNLHEGDACTVGGQMHGTCATRGSYFACFPQ